METIVTAVNVTDWRNCPHCSSEFVYAVKNGFEVEDIPTDLMFCLQCKSFYIVFPDWYFKGKGKAKKIAAFPKDVKIEISDALIQESEELLTQTILWTRCIH